MTYPSRRRFLQTFSAATAALPFMARDARAEPAHKFPGVLGLELYTVRHLLDKDVPGTLKLVKDWGFTDVEGGNWYGRSAAEFKTLIGQYGLRMQSVLTGYEKLRDDAAQRPSRERLIRARRAISGLGLPDPFARGWGVIVH